MDPQDKLQRMIDSVSLKVRKQWFERKFTEFGALADKQGYVKYTPKLIGAENYSKKKQIKWEKMLEHQLFMANKKMERPDGRLKGFWI